MDKRRVCGFPRRRVERVRLRVARVHHPGPLQQTGKPVSRIGAAGPDSKQPTPRQLAESGADSRVDRRGLSRHPLGGFVRHDQRRCRAVKRPRVRLTRPERCAGPPVLYQRGRLRAQHAPPIRVRVRHRRQERLHVVGQDQRLRERSGHPDNRLARLRQGTGNRSGADGRRQCRFSRARRDAQTQLATVERFQSVE